MRRSFYLAALALMLMPAAGAHGAEIERFAIYYSDTLSADHFKPYQLVILDGVHHPPLQPMKESGAITLGYLSLGEINSSNPSFIVAKSHNLILQENPNWKDSYFVDIRDPFWAKTVVEDMVPAILRQGFSGVFLDTLDSSIELERSNPAKYAGMSDAALHLIQAIRLNYPTTKIMMNRAYALLPKAAPLLDMELGESVYANYNFAKKTYGKVDDAGYHQQVDMLQAAKRDNPNLKIYTLDYADPSDQSEIKNIYRTERANGFIPYVTTIGLDRVVDEPGTH